MQAFHAARQSLGELLGRLDALAPAVDQAAGLLVQALRGGGKVLACGNGGSASQAQHLATELIGRFLRHDRRSLPAVALTADSSVQTALANDFGFEEVFALQIRALGRPGDVLVVLSTSGNSGNIIAALRTARQLGLKTIAVLGGDGGKARGLAEAEVIVPETATPRIQEAHLLLVHTLCAAADEAFAG
jgi:phosphoheptose isomerase